MNGFYKTMVIQISREAAQYLSEVHGCVYPNIPEFVLEQLRANAADEDLTRLEENILDKYILECLK